jgi:RNA polymerase sigma factor (TIGR02999 family)
VLPDLPPPAGKAAEERITLLLGAARSGDDEAQAALYAAVYDDLKRLARAQLRSHGRAGATLGTTALVHESYLRLAGPADASIEDRRHFFNLAARVMRHVIVDRARERHAVKRGAAQIHSELEDVVLADPAGTISADVIAIDRALETLAAASPELAQMVELRFFAGLTISELVPLLERSERTLKRDWRRAQAFLLAAINGLEPLPPP